MALQSSGQISLFNIRTELGLSGQVSLTTLSTTSLNTYSTTRPDGLAPHGIKEFYSYSGIATISSYDIYDNSNQGTLYYTISNGSATQYRLQTYDSNTSTWTSGSWVTIPFSDGTTNAGATSGYIRIGYLFAIPRRIEFTVLDSSTRSLYSSQWYV